MSLRDKVRAARHALPWLVEGWLDGPDAAETARRAARLARQGQRVTAGYFSPHGLPAATIVAAYRDFAWRARDGGVDACLSVKAPKLDFDRATLGAIAALGLPLVFDAHGPELADATQTVAADLGAGVVLPARWQRSLADAATWRDRPGRIRVVKGEWPHPHDDPADRGAAFLTLIERLAGREAPVGVATHDPALAGQALALLSASGTPCELELLRGLPRRRCEAVARRAGVPVRLYLPFGGGWWSYAVDSALERPYLPLWWLRDRVGY
ncbi:MAG: proline dehydrogenase [Proteobacteria bacterium]|nr:proline dehydrogenase [Pseudomonadota bacterium]